MGLLEERADLCRGRAVVLVFAVRESLSAQAGVGRPHACRASELRLPAGVPDSGILPRIGIRATQSHR
jgi:hypothetical protein